MNENNYIFKELICLFCLEIKEKWLESGLLIENFMENILMSKRCFGERKYMNS